MNKGVKFNRFRVSIDVGCIMGINSVDKEAVQCET